MSTQTVPNFLYIGTSKAGSTWLYNVLNQHPDVSMAGGKGTYFFDQHFDRGVDWYLSHFRQAGEQSVVGEVSHSYLFSTDACRRIAEHNQDVRLMACLREPVDRAFSAYLDRVKNGRFTGSFEDALDQIPSLLDRGRYATHLEPYIDQFSREQIHVGIFDDLKSAPARFACNVFRFLGVEDIPLEKDVLKKRMPAGQPRWRVLSRLAKFISKLGRRCGMRQLIGRAKTSIFVRGLLYREYQADEKPRIRSDTRQRLMEVFFDEVLEIDRMLGTDLGRQWGYVGFVENKL